MSCFIFHDWGKWSAPFETPWTSRAGDSGTMVIQTRTCATCGKIKWRKP